MCVCVHTIMSCHGLSLEFKERPLVSTFTFCFIGGGVCYVVSPLGIWSASFWVFSCLGLCFPTGMLGLHRHATTSSSYIASGDLNSALTLEGQKLLPAEPPCQPLKSSLVAAWVSVASALQPLLREIIIFYTSAQSLSSHPDCECFGTSVVPVCLLMRGVILSSQDD